MLDIEKYKKNFEHEHDPNIIRNCWALRPYDILSVVKGCPAALITNNAKLTVTDVYKNIGEKSIVVKLLCQDRISLWYCSSDEKMEREEITLSRDPGLKIKVIRYRLKV
jgi:hypothetical protein